MTKYYLGPQKYAELVDEYGIDNIDYVYGLRLLEVCIENAREICASERGFDDVIEWLHDLSQNVEEGFEHIKNFIRFEESDDEVRGDSGWDDEPLGGSKRIDVSELTELMVVVAEGLESTLDNSASASAVPDLNDDEEEQLERDVEAVVEKLTEVGYETYHFLIAAQFHDEKLDLHQVTPPPGAQEIGSLFVDRPAKLKETPLARKSDVRHGKTQVPARYRAARADARLGTIKRNIEKAFGLPKGSIALRGPDGKFLRANALISTLRRRWSKHYQED